MTQPTSPTATTANALPNEGDLIAGKYRIEKMLGKGGMGAVYAANHEILYQKVAIKVLLTEIAGVPEAVSRFLNEARAAARIQSEHVARVLDVGTENGMPYMVMEYLEGEDLGKLVETRGPMPPQEVVDCVLEALEAVAQAHAMQIVHRDLKPANLFLSRRQDGRSVVKVLDFGISKAQSPLAPGSGGMTSTKAMLGSPFYMSPEQLRSSKSVDARTDIWSMGVIMYELLCGVVPYNGDNLGELFAAILEQPPPPVRTRRPDVPPELEAIVLRCLQRSPDQRFASARELASALVKFASPRGVLAADRIRVSTMGGAPAAPAPVTSPGAASVYAPSPGPAMPAPHGPTPPGLNPPYGPPAPPFAGPAGGAQSAPGTGPSASTSAAWGNTGAGLPKASKAPLVVGVAIGAVLLLAVGGVAAVKMRGSHAAASSDPAPTTATTTAPPPAEPAKTAEPIPAPAAPTAAADSGVALVATAAPAPNPPPPSTPRPSPAGRPRPSPPTAPPVAQPAAPAAPPPSPPATNKPAGGDLIPGHGRN